VVGNPVSEGRAWMRILVTLALLAVFQLAALLPLPGTDTSSLERLGGRVNVIALGMAPFSIGFVFVELLSFVLPMGRKLRRGGIVGRSKLNAFAIRVGLGLAVLQAAGIAITLQTVAPGGASAVPNPGLLFILSSVTTLVAGATLAFLVAKLVSRWGVGNGFCLIILLQYMWPAFARVHNAATATDFVFGNMLEGLAWLVAIGLLVWRFALRPQAALRDSQQEMIPLLALPAFSQGILPVLWAYGIFNFLSPLRLVFALPRGVERSPIALLFMTVLIAAFSLGAFHLFSSRERLERNLPPGALPPEGGAIPRSSLLQSTAVLVVFGVGFPAGERYLDFRFAVFGFPVIVMAVALGFDLVAEWRFRQRHGDRVACLIEMDNVYYAGYLHGFLAKQGFDSLIRAFHYRSLFFDLGPIVKIELLVPAAELKPVQEIIRPERIEVV
jgi:SecY